MWAHPLIMTAISGWRNGFSTVTHLAAAPLARWVAPHCLTRQLLLGFGRHRSCGWSHDRVVYEVADIPMVDGPADGRTATVELDDDQMPPQRLELDEGVYELEPVAGTTAPWLYRWTPEP